MVVTDPNSYSYYVEEIKKATEQVKNLQEISATNTKTLEQLRGVYRSGRTAISALQEKIDSAKKIESSIKKYKRLAKDGDFVDAKEIMEDIFRDPRKEPDSTWRDADRRYEAEQTAVRGVITDADAILNAMPARFDIVQELLGEIGKTENIKAAMDLQNRISAEMLQVLLEMLNFSAKVAQAESMLNYQGVSETAAEKKQPENERAETAHWMRERQKKLDDELKKLGQYEKVQKWLK